MRCGAIDIGSNSVLLTIAELEPSGGVIPVEEAGAITRLARGLKPGGNLLADRVEETLEVLASFMSKCRAASVESVAAVATEALRRAGNGGEFITLAGERLGLAVEIIGQEREAELEFVSVAHDFGAASPRLAVLDIGGGSTELISGNVVGMEIESVDLFDVGCVRLSEKYLKSDPPSEIERLSMCSEITAGLSGLGPLPEATLLTATAGTATTLMAVKIGLHEYRWEKVHGGSLSLDDILSMTDRFMSLALEERRKVPGLEPKRADVIIPGAAIFAEVMRRTGRDLVRVSDRGVRWGLAYEMLSCVKKPRLKSAG